MRALRIAIGVVAAAVVVWLLFTVVFPRVDVWLDDPAMEPRPDDASAPRAAA